MDILFENKYVRDKEMVKDIYGYMYFRRPLIVVINIIFALHGLIDILNLVFSIGIDLYRFMLMVFWFVFIVIMYHRNVNLVLKRDLEVHGRPVEVSLVVTDDTVKYVHSTGSEYILNYNDIKKVIQTKEYIYLWSKTKMAYPLKKDGFSVGNEADFIEFLKNKGIKIK